MALLEAARMMRSLRSMPVSSALRRRFCAAAVGSTNLSTGEWTTASAGSADEAIAPEPLKASGNPEVSEETTKKLAGKVCQLFRTGRDSVVIAATGEVAAARTMRALAIASAKMGPAEFHAKADESHKAPGSSLRFHVAKRYSWTRFKRIWSLISAESKLMPITPGTDTNSLARAILAEQRKHRVVALSLNPSNDTVLKVAAEALALLQSSSPQGAELICVLRWPSGRGGHRMYAHVLHRSALPDE
mmetsp:Transcript_336/g.824  ORF Transcript_336/g.824 Transcript_336/m.824 type:complete len:246 (-) Transcript_336:46-783(-)